MPIKHIHAHTHRLQHPNAFGHYFTVSHAHEHSHGSAAEASLLPAASSSSLNAPAHKPHRHTPEQERELSRQMTR